VSLGTAGFRGEKAPARGAAITERRAAFYPFALIFFACASTILFGAILFWRSGAGFWGPGGSTLAAWGFVAVHVVSCRRVLNAFDPVAWVPVLMLLFYMGLPISIHLFGVGTYDSWGLGYPPRLDQAFAVALLCIATFILGTHLAGFRNLSEVLPDGGVEPRSIRIPALCLLWGGFAMTLVGIAVTGADLLFGDYSTMRTAHATGASDMRLFGTGQLFAQAGVFGVLATHNSRRKLMTWVALGLAALLVLLMIGTGDRGGLGALIFGTGWVYSLRVRRVPSWSVVAGFLFAFLMIPVVGEYRIYGDAKGAEQQSVAELVAGSFYEMGGTINVFCYTIDNIPSNKPYDWGLSYVAQILRLIPNFGIMVGGQTTPLSTINHDPSNWLTLTASPSKYYLTSARYGYAMGAEWYFNYGLPGVLVGMTLIGWVTGRFRNSARNNPFWLTVSALYVSMMMLLVRNSLAYPIRTMVWPLVGMLIIYALVPKRRKPDHATSDLSLNDLDRSYIH
jgi:oligosaccharide repeat unit polymerase